MQLLRVHYKEHTNKSASAIRCYVWELEELCLFGEVVVSNSGDTVSHTRHLLYAELLRSIE